VGIMEGRVVVEAVAAPAASISNSFFTRWRPFRPRFRRLEVGSVASSLGLDMLNFVMIKRDRQLELS
jgi:hypothetical protein